MIDKKTLYEKIDKGCYEDALEEMNRIVVINGLKRYIKIAMKALDEGDIDTYAVIVAHVRQSLKTLETDGVDELMRAFYDVKGDSNEES